MPEQETPVPSLPVGKKSLKGNLQPARGHKEAMTASANWMEAIEAATPGAGWGAAAEAAAARGGAAGPTGLEALYAAHHAAVFLFLCRRTGDAHAAEDLAAEVFVTAMRKWPRAARGGAPARAWLIRVASFKANHWSRARWRRMKRERGASTREQVGGAEPCEVDSEMERIQDALLRLPPRQQHVLGLFYFAEMSIEQIARLERVSGGTVKSRLSRARESLRRELNTARSNDHERTT